MLLNPFLESVQNKNVFKFHEIYSANDKPFISLKTSKIMGELLSNSDFTNEINKTLNYPFAISDEQANFFELLRENVEKSPETINKYYLSRTLLTRLYCSNIELYNFTKMKFDELEKAQVHYGEDEKIVICVREKYDKRKFEEQISFEEKKGLICVFEIQEEKLISVGPFCETEYRCKSERENEIEYIAQYEKQYWDRPVEEVILDTFLCALTDYFSDYATASSPFFYRKANIKKDRVELCKNLL